MDLKSCQIWPADQRIHLAINELWSVVMGKPGNVPWSARYLSTV